MQATYHIKASEVTTSLLTDIKSLFRGEEVLTITVSSEEPGEVLDPIYRFLELEKNIRQNGFLKPSILIPLLMT
ncbi:hypothetical protein [Dyadobacter sp. 32]|uniref:hypothetical protein n=1 Tax=Dyadobacter sp. 32 TaxID=538966 RepID=UPI0011EDE597